MRKGAQSKYNDYQQLRNDVNEDYNVKIGHVDNDNDNGEKLVTKLAILTTVSTKHNNTTTSHTLQQQDASNVV